MSCHHGGPEEWSLLWLILTTLLPLLRRARGNASHNPAVDKGTGSP